MKKYVLFTACTLLLLLFSIQAEGQIVAERQGMKKVYRQNGEPIDSKQLVSLLNADPVSSEEFEKSRTSSIIGLSSMVAGTACLGVGLFYTVKEAQALNEGSLADQAEYQNKSIGSMLLGVGFFAASVPFFLISNSHLNKSINLYNSSHASGGINDVNLYFGFTGDGIGIKVSF
jgi:hypothetical protein